MIMCQSYSGAQAITPNDATNVPRYGSRVTFDAIHVGGAGTVTVVLENGNTVQFTATAGSYLHIQGKRVNSTGTAGTLLVAMYL